MTVKTDTGERVNKTYLASILAKVTDFSQSELMEKSLAELKRMKKRRLQDFAQVASGNKTGGVIRRRGGGIAKRGMGIAK